MTTDQAEDHFGAHTADPARVEDSVLSFDNDDEPLFVNDDSELPAGPNNLTLEGERQLIQAGHRVTQETVSHGAEVQVTHDLQPEQQSLDAQPEQEPSREMYDRVQLASILKDFDASNDPMYEKVPKYMAAIVKELLEADFLLVLGRGLGLSQVLQLFLAKIRQASPGALVLCLGLREDEDSADVKTGAATDDGVVGLIGFGISSSRRSSLYNDGGTYSISAPILVMDILTGVLDAGQIAGLVIVHAESVGENSPAAFAIRLVQQRSGSSTFIKALSEAPERLVLPPSLPGRLRTLAVPTIMLWPRFHLAIDRALPRLQVDEIIVEQPEQVRRQQALLAELLQAVLSDVKRRVPHLDVDYLMPMAANDSSQARTGRPNPTSNEMDQPTTADALLGTPDLHWRIRNALQGVWHQLSKEGRLSVSALGTLQQLLHTLTHLDATTFWLQLENSRGDHSQPWTDLPAADALAAEARRAALVGRLPAKYPHISALLSDFRPGERVLIMCDSPRTMLDLHYYLVNGGDVQTRSDFDTLEAAEEEFRRADEEKERKRMAERAEKVNEGRPRRRRVRGGSAAAQRPDRAAATASSPSSPSPGPAVKEATPLDYPEAAIKRKYDEIDLTSEIFHSEPRDTIETSVPFAPVTVIFSTYRNAAALVESSPDQVIMYDPNLSFTREVERYAASTKEVEVHFMYYQRSVEELQYLTAMRREKDAFTKLIREKGLMPMVLRDGEDASNEAGGELRLIGSRRQYATVTTERPRIVVDMREFRSALPFLIWQSRMDVYPATLLVGDYILTPDTVVERKSVTDLIGSFRDGRLYSQCESMLKYYKIAILLIEFDGLSHFSMEPFKDIRARHSARVQREIQENISALLLRFPKIKLVWSASPLHTASIFKGLKELEPEPDATEAVKAGQTVLFDSIALSMLEAIPGITAGNAPLLEKHVSTITELAEMPERDLIEVLGPENGAKVWQFMTTNPRAASVADKGT